MTGGMAANGLEVVEVDVGERKCRLFTYTGSEKTLDKLLGDQVVSKGRFERAADGSTYRVIVVGGGGVGTSALTIKYENDDAVFEMAREKMRDVQDSLGGVRRNLEVAIGRYEMAITPEMREPEQAATRLRAWGETWGNFMRMPPAAERDAGSTSDHQGLTHLVQETTEEEEREYAALYPQIIDWESFDERVAAREAAQLRMQPRVEVNVDSPLVRLERFLAAESQAEAMLAEAMADREVQRAAERKAARKQQKKDRKQERRHQQRAAREVMRRAGKR